jgi:quinol monooxygenase YgiN
MSVVLIATLLPAPGQRDALFELLEEVIPRVHAEDAGCELHALHEDDTRVVLIEKWADGAARSAHGNSLATRGLMEGLDGKLAAAPEILVLHPRPVGAAAQGAM